LASRLDELEQHADEEEHAIEGALGAPTPQLYSVKHLEPWRAGGEGIKLV